ncbi:MAG: hypothetical protein JO256_05605 [Alphaproteobacteria bacterium]|nr:hypothetical protein [Alphaproteobacteria bacterium]
MGGSADNTSVNRSARYKVRIAALLRDVATFCANFLRRNFGRILLRLSLPGFASGAVLYFLLSGYCERLLAFMARPSGGIASQVLGIVAVGSLVLLLLHAIVAALVADLICQAEAPWSLLRVGLFAWRIYSASLRMVLTLGSAALLLGLTDHFAGQLLPALGLFAHLGVIASILWLWARMGFFLVPVCAKETERRTLQTAWRTSAGHLLLIAVVLVTALALAAIMQLAGEIVLRATGIGAPLSTATNLTDLIALYLANLVAVTVLLSVTYLLLTVVLVIAQVYIYDRLVAAVWVSPPDEGESV